MILHVLYLKKNFNTDGAPNLSALLFKYVKSFC